jgi:hypothetical protein
MTKIEKIGSEIMSLEGVQALSDRPNSNTAYGEAGLTAEALKKRFDFVPGVLVEKVNEIIPLFNELAELTEPIAKGLADGNVAQELKVKDKDDKLASLQDVLIRLYKIDITTDTLDQLKRELVSIIEAPSGSVGAGDKKPVSGSAVHKAIEGVRGEVSSLGGEVSSLSGEVSSLSGEVDDIKETVSMLEGIDEDTLEAIESIKNIDKDTLERLPLVDLLKDMPTDSEGNPIKVVDLVNTLEPNGSVAAGEKKAVSGNAVHVAVEGVRGDVSSLSRTVGAVDQSVKTLSDDVDRLESKVDGMRFTYETSTTLAYAHPVPQNALGFAILDKIGGYTRKSKNLLKLPKGKTHTWNNGGTTTTITVDENGYLCIDNGGEDTSLGSETTITGIGAIDELLVNKPTNATLSVRYISGSASESDNVQGLLDLSILGFSINGLPTSVGQVVSATQTNAKYADVVYALGRFTNYKIALMIEEGTTATDFEPYFEGLKSAKVRAVKSYGRNLVPPEIYKSENWLLSDGYLRYNLPAVPFDGDYTLTVKKNPNIDWGSAIISLFVSKNGGSFAKPDGWLDSYMITSNMYKSPVTLSLKKGDMLRLAAYPATQETIDKIMDVQFERGSKATAYVRGGVIDGYEVPNDVQARDGYGIGISTTNNNHIDFASKTLIRVNNITQISADLPWGGGNGSFYANHTLTDNSHYGECYCNTFKGSPKGAYNSQPNTISLAHGIVYIYNKNITTVDILKKYLRDNPTYLVYTLKTPSTEPLAEHITDTVYLRVEGGGYIVAENFDGIEAPITMTYQKVST